MPNARISSGPDEHVRVKCLFIGSLSEIRIHQLVLDLVQPSQNSIVFHMSKEDSSHNENSLRWNT